jgi:hypothetical protein
LDRQLLIFSLHLRDFNQTQTVEAISLLENNAGIIIRQAIFIPHLLPIMQC